MKEFPGAKALGISMGLRTVLSAPLLRDGTAIGVIHIRRRKKRAFSPTQIKLLETFADQAVIAIENARLFQELNESLEQQTATSEILGVIASSPTDIQPVLEAITERAARMCGTDDGVIRLVDGNDYALGGALWTGTLCCRRAADQSAVSARPRRGGSRARPSRGCGIRDSLEYPEVSESNRQVGVRTVLAAPLLREGIAIGVIHFRRIEPRPFSEKQIALLKTFADQAVIAIENVRLFKELQERNRDVTRGPGPSDGHHRSA